MNSATNTKQHLKISVIIPARNEAPNLQHVIPHIPQYIGEVLLINGHSTDDTVAEARRLHPDVQIVEQVGMGKGDAIRAGLVKATGDIIVLLDADGSADPAEITCFVDTLLAGNDFAKGSRFLKGGGNHDITWIRRAGNHGLVWMVNLLFNTHFTDLCYGYNAFWKHCLAHLDIDSDGFEVEALITIRMHTAGLKIAEVPSVEYQRIYGTSNLHAVKDGWRIFKLIVRERKGRKPMLAAPITQPQSIPERVI